MLLLPAHYNPTSICAMLTYSAVWSGNARMTLYGITGRQMFEQQQQGTGVIALRFGQCTKGIYVNHSVSEGTTLSQSQNTIQN